MFLIAAVFVTTCASAQSVGDASSTAKPEKLLTPQQSKELLASVGEMLQFSSHDTGLDIRAKVKGRITNREEIEKVLTEKLKDDKDARRMERSELVMKKFGLLDASFHLKPFLIALLKEQIAGYYDDKTKVMNLLSWVDIDEQKPVMAHELTHALQDQRVNLKKWQDGAAPDDTMPSKGYKEDQARVATDEVNTARDAVLEGQAMVPLIDWGMKSTGNTVKSAPQVVPLMIAQMAQTDPATSPVMARAPLMLQESMLFSYTQGLQFESAILTQKGIDRAFADTLDAPPVTSAEILHPAQYLAHARQPLIQLPDLHPLLDATYAPYDVGVVGEFDVKTMADVFVGAEQSAQITPMWQGGTYYAAQRRTDQKTPREDSTASIAIVYYSEWKTPQAAERFAEIYKQQIPRKYGRVSAIKANASADADSVISDRESAYQADGTYVLVAAAGNSVFIAEGFTEAEAHKMQVMFLAGRTAGAVEAKLVPMQDLSSGLRRFLSNAGMMRFALPQAQ